MAQLLRRRDLQPLRQRRDGLLGKGGPAGAAERRAGSELLGQKRRRCRRLRAFGQGRPAPGHGHCDVPVLAVDLGKAAACIPGGMRPRSRGGRPADRQDPACALGQTAGPVRTSAWRALAGVSVLSRSRPAGATGQRLPARGGAGSQPVVALASRTMATLRLAHPGRHCAASRAHAYQHVIAVPFSRCYWRVLANAWLPI